MAPRQTGGPNGVSGRLPFDRWFRYPAGFSPATLDRCFGYLSGTGGLIVDPFAGVATTGTAAIARGHAFRGIETHPLVAEIGALKFASLPEARRSALLPLATSIAADACLTSRNVDWNESEDETSLVLRCFDPETLATLVALRAGVAAAPEDVRGYLRIALTGLLRDVASVKVGWPHQRPAIPRQKRWRSTTNRFCQRVSWLAADLETLAPGVDATVTVGDSRREEAWRAALGGKKAMGCISSPPYLNNFDYADSTRLEVYFFGIATTWAELCSRVRGGMVASSTQQSPRKRAEAGWGNLRSYPKTRLTAERLSKSLADERGRGNRSKEYDQLLPAYLADIADVLFQIRQHVERNGYVIWVIGDSAPYGVHIDTPQLVSNLANEIGLRTIETFHIRSRGSRWATNGSRHHVALAECMLVLKKVD